MLNVFDNFLWSSIILNFKIALQQVRDPAILPVGYGYVELLQLQFNLVIDPNCRREEASAGSFARTTDCPHNDFMVPILLTKIVD